MTSEIKTGARLESLAFTFCKIATFALIAQRFTLPIAALLAAVFYVLAFVFGKRDTRCWLQWPLLIAGVWLCVLIGWIYFEFFRIKG